MRFLKFCLNFVLGTQVLGTMLKLFWRLPFEAVFVRFINGLFAFGGSRFDRFGKENCFEQRKQLSFILLNLPNSNLLHSNGDYVASYLPPLLPYCIEFVVGDWRPPAQVI